MEIIVKDVERPRLTITPTRVTLKFPLEFEDKDRVERFAQHIADNYTVDKSYRGRFTKMGEAGKEDYRYCIQMSDDKGNNHFTVWEKRGQCPGFI